MVEPTCELWYRNSQTHSCHTQLFFSFVYALTCTITISELHTVCYCFCRYNNKFVYTVNEFSAMLKTTLEGCHCPNGTILLSSNSNECVPNCGKSRVAFKNILPALFNGPLWSSQNHVCYSIIKAQNLGTDWMGNHKPRFAAHLRPTERRSLRKMSLFYPACCRTEINIFFGH